LTEKERLKIERMYRGFRKAVDPPDTPPVAARSIVRLLVYLESHGYTIQPATPKIEGGPPG